MKLTIHFYIMPNLRLLLYVIVPVGLRGVVLTKYRDTFVVPMKDRGNLRVLTNYRGTLL